MAEKSTPTALASTTTTAGYHEDGGERPTADYAADTDGKFDGEPVSEQIGLRNRPIPKHELTQYTLDGSVDVHGNPSIRAKTGGWKACPFILGNEGCERLAYYGIGTNLVTYLTTVLHQGTAKAATNVTNWSGTCYITPLIGGFLADAYWGRYWTIAVFSFIYFLGMVLLTLSAAVPALKPPRCNANELCSPASTGQLAVFYLSLYLVALGTGGIKPCVSSFGADQFDDNHDQERARKTSFFNWFYFSINVGALISASALVYIQEHVGWGWGFGVPAVAMGIAIGSFFLGTPLYRHQKPGGSPLTRITQVVVAAFRKAQVRVPADPHDLHELHDKESAITGSRKIRHTKEFTFLDKAATPGINDLQTIKGQSFLSSWRLVTVTQVEEVKIMLRMAPIWAATIVFSTVYAQMSTLFVLQGQRMNANIGSFKIPAASLSIFDTLSVLFWVPVYDRLLVPFVRRYSEHVRGFTQLQRMGIGLFISICSMVAAAVVEIERLKIAKEKGLLDQTEGAVPMSIFWQVPQYFLIGASEVFTFIGQLEYFYDQAPDAMRGLSSAFSLTTVALGNYLSSLLVTIVTSITRKGGSDGWIPDNLNRGHIDYFFWLLAVLSFLNLLFYMVCAHFYRYKRVIAEVDEDDETAPRPPEYRSKRLEEEE
ncbi:MFS transporter, POT/PTR family, peptide/nitrate/nicotianamine transporter [Marchantia polymorpha subsp. ruderalis]|nr:hypothetical protein MARPO_0034s0039 [Marchantia polymorpha]BBN13587.1 hypothetical protein Mp_6g04780 [Marchantia polymorpha subsp. ruderalis]|eukprot:PTQ41444.1 hypothetical protein MARPO_0034s0039 [Marchantia polymorpha]